MLTGLDVLARDRFASLRGQRVGLVAHPASVDQKLRHVAELFGAAPDVNLVTLFGPEHGLLGEAQDLIGVEHGDDPLSGVRCISLYGDSFASLKPSVDQLAGLDVLVVDLQDVGSRYYTFTATMLYCLQAAAGVGLPVVVLDRPNPIDGLTIEGPTIAAGFDSFIGAHPLPIRHGLTIGELAQLYRKELSIDVELTVIKMEGWKRGQTFEATRLPWVLPSPNMPTADTAIVYPGQCLVEGTNLSEGRGTTRPFEICGGPAVDARRVAKQLNEASLPGVVFRPLWFLPTFQKHANTLCGGVQLHVTDRYTFRPVRTGLAVLMALRKACECFDWRRETYEFVSDRLAIDILFGSPREREAIEAGANWRDIAANWEAEENDFKERHRVGSLY